jgi:hypothetical protein
MSDNGLKTIKENNNKKSSIKSINYYSIKSKSDNNNNNNKKNNTRTTISSLTDSFSSQFSDNFNLNINPFNIDLNGYTKIDNMKQFILYTFISNNNLDGIKLYNTYVNKLYNKKNNKDSIKYTLDITKIMNNKNTLDLIDSDFYNLIDETTIIGQFERDIHREYITIDNIKYDNIDSFNTKINTIITPEVIQKINNNIELNNNQKTNFKNKIINIIKLICTQTIMGYLTNLEFIMSNRDTGAAISGDTLYYDIIINENKELLIHFETLLYKKNPNNVNDYKIKKINMTFNITRNNIEIDIKEISKANASKFLNNKKNNNLARQFIELNKKSVPKKVISETIPIKKNRANITEHPEFLIISYNEAAQAFDFNDISTIIKKIYEEKPKFIFVCTQESATSGKEHFQHILGEILKKRNKTNKIELLIQKMLNENNIKTKKTTYNLLTKFDASQFTLMTGNKNVRTRIYYESSVVINNIKTPKLSPNARPIISNSNKQTNNESMTNNENMTNTENVSNEEQSLLNNIHYSVKNVETKKSKQSGLGSALGATLYKGSIFTKLNIIKNGVPFKMIIINSHLFYKKNGDTGLNVRKNEFTDIIKEFNLIKLWKDGYNIFLCGDLNFRLVSYDGNKLKFNDKISKNIIKSYVDNNSLYKYNFTNNHKSENELYSYLNYLHMTKKNQNEKNFYLELLTSIETIGLHLTSKYFEGRKNKNINFYTQRYNIMNEKNLTNYNKKEEISRKTKSKIIPENIAIFNIRPIKNGHPRIPSMTDRIIFCLADTETNKNKKQYIPDISPANFNIFLTPDKSDHKMITLGFDIKLFPSNNNNIRSSVSSNNKRSSINSRDSTVIM